MSGVLGPKCSQASHWIARGLYTCEHALDGLLRQALGVLELLDCDRASAGHIAVDDWGRT